MAREPITLVEIDLDYCANTWGTAPCAAVLSAGIPNKCYNGFAGCKSVPNFIKGTKTLTFADPRANLPIDDGVTYFPALVDCSTYAATVNIAGTDKSLSPMGRRATVTVTLADFPYHDRTLDKYANERVSGAAMFSGIGADPAEKGSIMPKIKARFPYYQGRALRVITGEIVAGAIINKVTKSYVMTNWIGPGDDWQIKIEAQDILWLADSDRAIAPAPGKGTLAADLTISATTATLQPTGIGAQYDAAGRVCIGSECLDFTRVGDVLTITRGVVGTVAATHNLGDTVQPVLQFNATRIDTALALLLQTYAGVPASWIDAAAWATEVTRWAASLTLTGNICAPTPVADLVAEIQLMGVSIWSDAENAKIGLKINHPADGETVTALSDRDNIKSVSLDDRAAERLTEVYFYSVQIDPTKGKEDPSNYGRLLVTADLAAKGVNAYGDTRVKRVFARLLQDGNDADISVLSRRLLNRFNRPPLRATLRLDAKDALGLADLVSVQTAKLQDEAGATSAMQMQVISVSEPRPGHEIEIIAQAFQFAGRYAYALADSAPVYGSASTAQKAVGFFAVDTATLIFAVDYSGPYQAI
ncbi:MAG: hypothetical protein WCO04_14965 [Pseudomonadota bacterium]